MPTGNIEKRRPLWPVFPVALLGLVCLGCLDPADRDGCLPDDASCRRERLLRELRTLPTVRSAESWPLPGYLSDRDPNGLIITTSHYRIYTTLRDPLILRRVPVFMESAFGRYRELVVGGTGRPGLLDGYFFGTRGQWEQFTGRWAGEQAAVILRNPAGAYCLGGVCVAYHLQRQSDFSVLAHEGWHQFADARLAYALPAWLDEGLALQFEAYRWDTGRVQFEPRLNASRLLTLKRVMAAGRPVALVDLLRLDAGRVLSHTRFDPADPGGSGVAVYYAQLYGLIRFLREADYGRYRRALQTLLQDGQAGRWPLTDSQRQVARRRQGNPSRLWNAQVGLMLFETYIGSDLPRLQAEYEAFCRQITAEWR